MVDRPNWVHSIVCQVSELNLSPVFSSFNESSVFVIVCDIWENYLSLTGKEHVESHLVDAATISFEIKRCFNTICYC